MSVATAGVICGWLLAAPEEVCPHCCAALLRDVLGGHGVVILIKKGLNHVTKRTPPK
eukprot:COSAG02_NODE_57139_length_282_cov_0.431694_1_plen_56_part_01